MSLFFAIIVFASISFSNSNGDTNSIKESTFSAFSDNIYVIQDDQIPEMRDSFLGQIRKTDIRENVLYFIFLGLLLCIILFVFISSPEYFKDLFLSVFTVRYFLSILHKKKYTLLINNILLDIVFLSAFVFFVFLNTYTNSSVLLFKQILIAIGISYFTLILILFLFYHIFFGLRFSNLHLKNTLMFNRAFAIVATPIIFVSFYLDPHFRTYTFTILALILMLFFIWRFLRMYRILKNTSTFGIIYILLYLCVFEICPYMIIYKEFGGFLSLKV